MFCIDIALTIQKLNLNLPSFSDNLGDFSLNFGRFSIKSLLDILLFSGTGANRNRVRLFCFHLLDKRDLRLKVSILEKKLKGKTNHHTNNNTIRNNLWNEIIY